MKSLHSPRSLRDLMKASHQAPALHAQGDGHLSGGSGNRQNENGFASAAAPIPGGMGSPLTRTPFRLNLMQDSVTEACP